MEGGPINVIGLAADLCCIFVEASVADFAVSETRLTSKIFPKEECKCGRILGICFVFLPADLRLSCCPDHPSA